MGSKQTPASMLTVAALAGAVGLVAFLVMMVIMGFSFSPAFFIALLLAVVVAIILLRGFHSPADSAPSAGQTDQDTEAAATHTAPAAHTSPTPAPPAEPAPAAAPTPEVAPAAAPTPTAAPATTPAASKTTKSASADEPKVKPSKRLAGQEELSGRKGDWKYGGSKAAPAEAAPAKASPKPSAAADVPAGDVEKPQFMSAPRDGGADNLKEIKGVGPKLEKLLNDLGVYHFDQIAAWRGSEIAWMDDHLEGFRGRVSRDDWVAQARTLAAGGETEFSKRVDKGGVY